MLVPFLVFSRVLLRKGAFAIALDLSLFVLSVLNLRVICNVGVEEVFGGSFNPFALILVSFLSWDFFLLHEVVIETTFDHHFNEEVLPVLEQDLKLLLKVL